MSRVSVTRRSLATGLFQASMLPLLSRAVAAQVADRGIGGTGAAAVPDGQPSDRGIGGTGVIGTIRGFGSIVVNGLRIAYPRRVAVTIDDETASVADLKLGQVVRVVAHRHRGAYRTRAIAVTSEVVGPVQAVAVDRLVVLGQEVIPTGPMPIVAVADIVAVAGIRQADGAIVASLIEHRMGAPARVSGPVRASADGRPMIGDLALEGLDPPLVGRRCAILGDYTGDVLIVRAAQDEQQALIDMRPTRLVIEAYVSMGSTGLTLGSGLAIAAGRPAVQAHADTPAVVAADITGSGQIAVRSVHTESGTTSHAPGSGPGGSGRDASGARDGGPPPGTGGNGPSSGAPAHGGGGPPGGPARP